jgi:hypothetical protein
MALIPSRLSLFKIAVHSAITCGLMLAVSTAKANTVQPEMIQPYVTYTADTSALKFRISITGETRLNPGDKSHTVTSRRLAQFKIDYEPRLIDKANLTAKGIFLGSRAFHLTEADLASTEVSVEPTQEMSSPLLQSRGKNYRFDIKNRPDLPFDHILIFTDRNQVAFVTRTEFENSEQEILSRPRQLINELQVQGGILQLQAHKSSAAAPVLTSAGHSIRISGKGGFAGIFGVDFRAEIVIDQMEDHSVFRSIRITRAEPDPLVAAKKTFLVYDSFSVSKVLENKNGFELEFSNGKKLTVEIDLSVPDISMKFDKGMFSDVHIRNVDTEAEAKAKNEFHRETCPVRFLSRPLFCPSEMD